MTHYDNLNIDLGGDGYVIDSAWVRWDVAKGLPTPYRLTFKDEDGYEVEVSRMEVSINYSYDHPMQRLPFEAWLERVAGSIIALSPGRRHLVHAVDNRDADWYEAAWLLILDYIKENFNGQ